MDSSPITCYRCSQCKTIWEQHEFAEKCCVCQQCGKLMPPRGYCEGCRDINSRKWLQETIKAATDATESGDWGPMLYCESNERYYGHPEEVLDDFDEGCAPEWLFGTTECRNEFDLESAIERMEEGAYDDAEVGDSQELESLKSAIDAFNAKHAIVYYTPNYKVKARVPKGE